MTDVPPGAVVRMPGEAESVRMGGFDIIYHAVGADTASAFTLIETREPEPEAGPPLHIHRDAAESFLVLAGEYLFHLDGRDYHCTAGAFVYVPQGMPHRFSITAPNSRKLNLYTPSAMEGYFRELAAAIREGLGETALNEIAERYNVAVLGPAAESYLSER